MSLTIGKAIKIIREAKRRSLGKVASEANVSVPYLSLIESDKRNPSLDVIRRLSEALEVPEEVFVLVACGTNSSLATQCDLTTRLLGILQEMEQFEERLRDAVKKQGC